MPLGACEKIAIKLRLGSDFQRELKYPLTPTADWVWISLYMTEKIMIIEIPTWLLCYLKLLNTVILRVEDTSMEDASLVQAFEMM